MRLRVRQLHRTFLAALAAAALAAPASAEGPRLSVTAGAGRAYGQTYYQLGGRVGWDVGIGLTPEVGLAYWGGADPTFFQLTPGVTWYFPLPLVRPYLGAFYVHDFVRRLPDSDGVGVRGGLQLLGAGPVSVNLGISYVRRLGCAGDCDTWWPEAAAGLSF